MGSRNSTLAMKEGSYNTRGLRSFYKEVDKLAEQMNVLFLSETWIRKSDANLADMVNEWIFAPIVNSRNKGFGGVAAMVNPLRRYEMVTKIFMRTIRSLTIRVKGATIASMYRHTHMRRKRERNWRKLRI